MINISKLPAPFWFGSASCFFLIITIIIFPFVIFKVHRDIEKQYCVSINYPAGASIVFLGKYALLAYHVVTFYIYYVYNSKFIKFIFKRYISYSFLTEFNYNVKEEKKSNLIICAIFYTSNILCIVLMTCAVFMINPTWMFD